MLTLVYTIEISINMMREAGLPMIASYKEPG